MTALALVHAAPESVSGLSRRLAELLERSESEGVQGLVPDAAREQATDLVEALRRRIIRKPDRDHRSLFELDDRLIETDGTCRGSGGHRKRDFEGTIPGDRHVS